MRYWLQYADGTEWEGHPSTVAQSPDKGVIRARLYDDEGRYVEFAYDDFYFVYAHPSLSGAWVAGSGTPKREFYVAPGEIGTKTYERPVLVPPGAVVRRGQTVSQEEAVAFGLVEPDGKLLSPVYEVRVEEGTDGADQVPAN